MIVFTIFMGLLQKYIQILSTCLSSATDCKTDMHVSKTQVNDQIPCL